MKTLNKNNKIVLFAVYAIFLFSSLIIGFEPGVQIGRNFLDFAIQMLKILPCAFLLIGLFEVWVKKEDVEKHLGEKSSHMSYLWIFLLASTSVGGVYVAFPVACSLYKKGAKLNLVFTYIGASAICRIPMTIFEASFVGIKFSIIRLLVAIPLVILTSAWLGNYLESRNYCVPDRDL